MSLRYLYGHNEAVAHFVAQLIPRCRERGFPPTARGIGVLDEEGVLIAGIVYHNWEPEAEIIEISGAALPGKQWLSRETIRRMYQYPFHQLGCQMVFQRNSANDERLLGMLACYGYALIRIPRMLGRDHDGVIATLTVEDWAGNRFNRRLKHHVIEMAPILEAAA
jgi:RimJ/RimL family protein N-acetyltransferase